MAHDLPQDEQEFLRAFRRAKAGQDGPIRTVGEAEFEKWAKRDGGLVAKATRERVRATIRRVTNIWQDAPEPVKGRGWTPYDGPRVILNGTLADARASWRLHFEDLVDQKGVGGPTIRRHREAVTHYLRCAGSEWCPETTKYEQRSLHARSLRSQNVELPDDFVARAASIVNDVQYHKDPAVNAMFQHRARLNFFTGPRCPSEDNRLRLADVHTSRGVVVYRVSKLGLEETDPILVPREVFDLAPTVLTHPKRKSWTSWVNYWRPKLAARAELRYESTIAKHDYAWVHSDGLPTDPEHYRKNFGLLAKEAWPGFYPYLTRELAIIMRALDIVQKHGHLDVEKLVQWSDHVSWDNLRRYLRRARQIMREYEPGPELDDLLNQWRNI